VITTTYPITKVYAHLWCQGLAVYIIQERCMRQDERIIGINFSEHEERMNTKPNNFNERQITEEDIRL